MKTALAMLLLLVVASVYAAPLDTLRPEHPRLLWTSEQEAQTEAWAEKDPLLQQLIAVVRQYADAGLTEPVFSRVVEDSEGRLKDQRRAAMFRIFNCALTYRLTGDLRYAHRVRDDLLSGSGVTLAGWKAAHPDFVEATSWTGHLPFTDWGPNHFLNVGEISALMAIGYDWIYHALTEAERAQIRNGIISKGLNAYISAYDGGQSWVVDGNNWNQVCNAGPLLAALAVAEHDPTKAEQVLSRAVASIVHSMEAFKPDGAWPEGPTYWAYGATYNAFFLGGLRTALGNLQGLDADDGYEPFGRSGAFHIQTVGPTNQYFSFGDAKQIAYFSPVLFFLSHEFNNPVYAFYERLLAEKDLPRLLSGAAMQDDTLDRFLALLVAWYYPAGQTLTYEDLPLDQAFRGESANAAMRTSWTDSNAAYLAFKGGRIKAEHGHMDVGTFVLDALGTRWAEDLGPDTYSLSGYFDFNGPRWQYYRLNNRGHNTLTINNALQNANANIPIAKFYSTPDLAYATLDMTTAYSGQATQVRRGYAMLDRRRILIEDEVIGAPTGQTIRWGMITRASIALEGNKATLSRVVGDSTAEPTVTTLTAVADAQIRKDRPGDNWGGRTTVDLKGSDPLRKGYFRFDLSSLPLPKELITSVAFRLKSADMDNDSGARGFELWTLNDAVNQAGRLGENWLEGTANGSPQPGALNWDNAPANNTADNTVDANFATRIDTLTLPVQPAFNEVLEWKGNVDSTLVNSLKQDTNDLVTMIVRRTDTTNVNEDFYAKENTSQDAVAAQLVVTQQQPGPSASMVAEILEPAGAVFSILSTNPGSPSGQNPNLGTSMLAVEVPAGSQPTRIVILFTPVDGSPAAPAPEFRPLATSNPALPKFELISSQGSISEFGQTSAQISVRRRGEMLTSINLPYSLSGTATQNVDYLINGLGPVLTFPTNGATQRDFTVTALADEAIEGQETIIFTPTSSPSYEVEPPSLTLLVQDRPRDAWRAQKFAGNLALAAWHLDPNGNGLSNLLEYSLGTEPLALDPITSPQPRVLEHNHAKYLALEYKRPYPAPLDIIYRPKVTGNLGDPWASGVAHVEESFSPPTGNFQTVTARDLVPLHEAPTRFIRLHVELLP